MPSLESAVTAMQTTCFVVPSPRLPHSFQPQHLTFEVPGFHFFLFDTHEIVVRSPWVGNIKRTNGIALADGVSDDLSDKKRAKVRSH
jgi:hypothetical protein